MIYVHEAVLVEKVRDQLVIRYTSLNESAAFRDMIFKTTAQIIHYHHIEPHIETMSGYMRSDKSGSPRHKYVCFHLCLLYFFCVFLLVYNLAIQRSYHSWKISTCHSF